jgi:hypothetical protein
MGLSYDDPALERLFEDLAALVVDGRGDGAALEGRLLELARRSPVVSAYWRRTRAGLGVPDVAFRDDSPYFFADHPPARTFRTSGTSGAGRGSAHYSRRGLALMDLSIVANARRHITGDLDRPAILRFVPPEAAAPEMVMAHGMELIARELGHPGLSACVIGPRGLDGALLAARLDAAVVEDAPVVLIGGSFAFVNVCDALAAQGKAWRLPAGSRLIDAGGFKGRSRAVTVDDLRAAVGRTFGVAADRCTNLFGMTELASQLYDAADVAVGPLGERPKGRLPFAWPRVRDPRSLELLDAGPGLLEVVDLCIIDRPHVVLTGDRGVAASGGVAVAGRIERGQSRGCSLTLDTLTAAAHG